MRFFRRYLPEKNTKNDSAPAFTMHVEKAQDIQDQPAEKTEDTKPANLRIDVIQDICRQVGKIGLEVLDSSGNIDVISKTMSEQVNLSSRLRDMNAAQMVENETAQQEIQDTINFVQETAADIVDVNQKINSAVRNINSFITANKSVNEQIGGLTGNITEVQTAVENIMAITKEVHILALNATIEAARAGEAGKGFQVVANEVKVLAGSTAEATQHIVDAIEKLAGSLQSVIDTNEKNSVLAETTVSDTSYIGEAMGKTAQSIQSINQKSANIHIFSQNVQKRSSEFNAQITVLDSGLEDAHTHLDAVKDRLHTLTDLNEKIGLSSIQSGVEVDDTFFVHLVLRGASEIAALFEDAVETGEITINELFDYTYTPITGSNPQQVMAKFTALTDKYLPAVQEPILSQSERIVFCAAVDINGYLPTHNNKFSQAQRPNDPEWNASNCRNRRIFDDRVGLRSGKNTDEFLVQLYRRDMGGGNFILMKDASAPIYVQGRHWGGFRMGYKVA